MEFGDIIFEKKEGVAKITLNRAEKFNALDRKTCGEILSAFEDIEQDAAVKVVVIAANGKAFCTGADIEELAQLPMDTAEDYLRSVRGREVADVSLAIENCTRPVIAALQGMTLAGGIELMEACDIVIAADNIQIGDQHVNFNFIPGGGVLSGFPA